MKNVKNNLFKGFEGQAIVESSMNQVFGGNTTIVEDPTPHYTNVTGTDCSSERNATTSGDTTATSAEFDTPPRD